MCAPNVAYDTFPMYWPLYAWFWRRRLYCCNLRVRGRNLSSRHLVNVWNKRKSWNRCWITCYKYNSRRDFASYNHANFRSKFDLNFDNLILETWLPVSNRQLDSQLHILSCYSKRRFSLLSYGEIELREKLQAVRKSL